MIEMMVKAVLPLTKQRKMKAQVQERPSKPSKTAKSKIYVNHVPGPPSISQTSPSCPQQLPSRAVENSSPSNASFVYPQKSPMPTFRPVSTTPMSNDPRRRKVQTLLNLKSQLASQTTRNQGPTGVLSSTNRCYQ
ncbi:hypothetical protein JTB14_003470 [Gonioctena quinquepunctata]|nr:hypothetical protein JTB14_003470 [Gonioctena quinquepunctata]